MSDSDSNGSEHELSYYAKDKVKLMKEVLKIIKPKKIKTMAPDCIKHMDIVEINSMLLEELLGISNKRLQYIFKGENADRETSSSESDDEEKETIDVISLDDISEDEDFDLCVASTSQKDFSRDKKKKHQTKSTDKIKIKKEKKTRKFGSRKESLNKKETEKDRLMNVLELLELQARARAIRSQLAIENESSKTVVENTEKVKKENDSDSDAVIIDSPQLNEIVITSESETEDCGTFQDKSEQSDGSAAKKQKTGASDQPITSDLSEAELNLRKAKLLSKLQKIKLIRNRTTLNDNSGNSVNTKKSNSKTNVESDNKLKDAVNETCELQRDVTSQETISKIEDTTTGGSIPEGNINFCDNDEIVINLDEDEMNME